MTELIVCVHCGYRASRDYVALTDSCPKCSASPFFDAQTAAIPEDPALSTGCEGCE